MSLSNLIVIAICAMLLLAFGVIFFVILYQRRIISHQVEVKKINEQKELELTLASIQSEERERRRIASELHDDVNATLSAARLFLYRGEDAAFDERKILMSKELLDEGINKIRNISHNLQPVSLNQIGLEAALRSLVKTIDSSGTINVSLDTINPLPRIAEQTELAIYRVCQELITNVIKHADAHTIIIETDATPAEVIISLIYNGTGMIQDEYEKYIFKEGALGLKNIVSRLKSINGTLHFFKSNEEFFKTRFNIPLTAKNKPV